MGLLVRRGWFLFCSDLPAEAILAKIPKSFYFHFVSRFCSRAFAVVGNLSWTRMPVNIEGTQWFPPNCPFGPRGCFWMFLNMRRPGFTLPVQTKSTSSGLGPVSGNKNEEDIMFLRFSTKVEKVKNLPLGQNDLFTTFLFLLGSTVRPQQKGGEVRLLLFRLFLFCLAAMELFSGGSDICLSADRLPWGSLGSEFGDPLGSPWVWRHFVRQAGPQKPLKT